MQRTDCAEHMLTGFKAISSQPRVCSLAPLLGRRVWSALKWQTLKSNNIP